eukprot:sb/3475474/
MISIIDWDQAGVAILSASRDNWIINSCEAKLLKPLQSGYSRMAQKRLCAYLIIQLSLEADKIATPAWQKGRGHFRHLLHLGWSERFFWCFWDPIGVQCKWKTFVMSQFTILAKSDWPICPLPSSLS